MLDWKGDELLAKVRRAESGALGETLDATAVEGKARVRVDTAALQSSIEVLQEPTSTGHGYEGLVGSDNPEIGYPAIQEQGPEDGREYGFTPYMRPAGEIEGKQMAGRIAKRLK